jgi:hypothetical protein
MNNRIKLLLSLITLSGLTTVNVNNCNSCNKCKCNSFAMGICDEYSFLQANSQGKGQVHSQGEDQAKSQGKGPSRKLVVVVQEFVNKHSVNSTYGMFSVETKYSQSLGNDRLFSFPFSKIFTNISHAWKDIERKWAPSLKIGGNVKFSQNHDKDCSAASPSSCDYSCDCNSYFSSPDCTGQSCIYSDGTSQDCIGPDRTSQGLANSGSSSSCCGSSCSCSSCCKKSCCKNSCNDSYDDNTSFTSSYCTKTNCNSSCCNNSYCNNCCSPRGKVSVWGIWIKGSIAFD